MKINLQITYSDKPSEPKQITCLASDMVKFESKFDISVADLDKNLKITHLLFLAWASETRSKGTTKTFEEWVDTVDSVEPAESPKE
jgi:hypothetical protein